MATVSSAMYVELNGVWTNITADVLAGTISAEWGMSSNDETDRVASPGELRFDLNNKASTYSPGTTAGWEKGVNVKHVFTFEGEEYVRFRGFVDDIQFELGVNGNGKVHVVVMEWLELAARHSIINPGIKTNQTGDEALNTILPFVTTQPLATAFSTGVNVFPTTFDTVNSKTKAYNEFEKIANSELGYIYQRHDRAYAETLVFEGAFDRNGTNTPSSVLTITAEAGLLKKEDGDYLLLENGDNLVLNESSSTSGITHNNDTILAIDLEYGRNVINRFPIYAQPRRLDTSPQILFQLDEPIAIDSGKTYTLKGYYADPNGGLPIAGQDMITPVITTDYLMNTQEDGGGTNISSDLSIIINYGTEGFTAQLTNGNASVGWVTQFNTRGTGIYNYNPIEHVGINQDSIDEFEVLSESITQRYKSDLYHGSQYADRIVFEEGRPRVVVNKIYMCANKSTKNIASFLGLDIGDVIRIIENEQVGVDGFFHINGVSYQVLENNIVMYQYIPKKIYIVNNETDLFPIAVEFAGGSSGDAINFGYVPHISNLRRRSISVWVYLDSDVPDTSYYNICGWGVNYLLVVKQNRKIKLYDQQMGVASAGGGSWISTNSNVIPLSDWTHIVVTHDTRFWPTSSAPLIYIDGSLVTLTEEDAADSNFGTETGMEFVVGNAHASNNNYLVSIDGKIADVRIYDHILTQAEVTALTGSAPNVLTNRDGMIFQAFAVPSVDILDYLDDTLTSEMKVQDIFTGFVGTPHGAPTGRALP